MLGDTLSCILDHLWTVIDGNKFTIFVDFVSDALEIDARKDGTVFDLEKIDRSQRPEWDNKQDSATNVDWFQHNRFEDYVGNQRARSHRIDWMGQ